jgi:hypothetical protein
MGRPSPPTHKRVVRHSAAALRAHTLMQHVAQAQSSEAASRRAQSSPRACSAVARAPRDQDGRACLPRGRASRAEAGRAQANIMKPYSFIRNICERMVGPDQQRDGAVLGTHDAGERQGQTRSCDASRVGTRGRITLNVISAEGYIRIRVTEFYGYVPNSLAWIDHHRAQAAVTPLREGT